MDFKRFKDRFELVQKRIDEVLVGDPKKLYDASNHLTKSGGKRVRPLLCMTACEAVGGSYPDVLDTAVALELIHTFTLIHDDIMDNDELRRGSPAVHTVFGEPTAILAGDLLFSKAFEIAEPDAIKLLAHASGEICEGQELDMSFEDRLDVSFTEYMEMIRKKTAVLLQAATESGAILGGGDNEAVDALSLYGLNVGLAFQIHDDVLDVIASEEDLGKPVGSDIAEGKMSIVAIKALESLEGEDGERLRILLGKENTKEEIEEAISLFESAGAIDFCKEESRKLIASAKDALGVLPDSPAKEVLFEFADFMVERRK